MAGYYEQPTTIERNAQTKDRFHYLAHIMEFFTTSLENFKGKFYDSYNASPRVLRNQFT